MCGNNNCQGHSFSEQLFSALGAQATMMPPPSPIVARQRQWSPIQSPITLQPSSTSDSENSNSALVKSTSQQSNDNSLITSPRIKSPEPNANNNSNNEFLQNNTTDAELHQAAVCEVGAYNPPKKTKGKNKERIN